MKGWFEHFKHSVLHVYKSIDGYVRARLRSLLRKQAQARSQRDEFLYVELLQSESDDTCDTLDASELGILVALVAEANGSHQVKKMISEGAHCYVVALPAVCSFRVFQGSSKSVRLIQLRVNFGRLLTVFPDLLNRAGLNRISAYARQLFVVAENG